MAPLTDAMRFVDGEQLNWSGSNRLHEFRVPQSLRRHIHELVFASSHILQSRLLFAGGQCAVDQGSWDPHLPHPIHLILHQRDQRGNDNGQAWSHNTRQLITQTLPTPSRHDAHAIIATYDRFNHLTLTWPKAGQSKAI